MRSCGVSILHSAFRDPTAHPTGIPYALVGETVVPGIAGGDADSIFEEHSVVASLRVPPPRYPCYARSERIFSFGPVVAAVGASTPKPATAGSGGGGDCGAVAGLKLSNPFKVHCVGCKLVQSAPFMLTRNILCCSCIPASV